MSQTTLARNISALRKHLKLNQTDFAERVGSKQANVSKWEGGVKPEALPLAAMADLAGVGLKEFTEKPWGAQALPVASEAQTLEQLAEEYGWVLIEEIDLSLGMGASFLDGNGHANSNGLVPFKAEWIRDMFRGSINHLKVVRGTGDSMEPTIRDGDLVLIDTSRRRLDEQDVIWAVSYGELGMIRRLRQLPGGGVQMMPDNAVVRPTEAYDGEMYLIGRVIWIGRRM